MQYEIVVSHVSGHIIWVNRSFPCGRYPDLKIFKSKIQYFLEYGETIVADNGYSHVRYITPNKVPTERKTEHVKIRSRHETVNERIKNVNAVRHIFRHHMSLHGFVFHDFARLTAMMISSGENLFEI